MKGKNKKGPVRKTVEWCLNPPIKLPVILGSSFLVYEFPNMMDVVDNLSSYDIIEHPIKATYQLFGQYLLVAE